MIEVVEKDEEDRWILEAVVMASLASSPTSFGRCRAKYDSLHR